MQITLTSLLFLAGDSLIQCGGVLINMIPSGDKVDKIVMISDIFGIYANAKLVADEWAGQGYEVYVPDWFDGKPVDEGLLNVRTIFWTMPVPLRQPVAFWKAYRADALVPRTSCPIFEFKRKLRYFLKQRIPLQWLRIWGHSWFQTVKQVSEGLSVLPITLRSARFSIRLAAPYFQHLTPTPTFSRLASNCRESLY